RRARRWRSRTSIYAGISLRESESIRRAHLSRRPPYGTAAACRPKGARTVRAHLVGRRTRRDRRSPYGNRAIRRWTASHSPILVRGHDGPRARLIDGSPLLSFARRVEARSDHLFD